MKIELGDDKYLQVNAGRVMLYYRLQYGGYTTESYQRDLDKYETNFVLKTIEHMKAI